MSWVFGLFLLSLSLLIIACRFITQFYYVIKKSLFYIIAHYRNSCKCPSMLSFFTAFPTIVMKYLSSTSLCKDNFK